MAHVIRCELSPIAELKTVVEYIKVNMREEKVRKMASLQRKEQNCAEIILEDILNSCWKK